MTADDELRGRLLDWLRLLVDAGAVTGQEAALAGRLAQRFRDGGHPVERVGDSLVVGAPDGERPVVALVGHLDVVPPTDVDLPLRVEETADGAIAFGRGTSDMHAGNAVACTLFEQDAAADGPYELVLVLYAREEGPADENELADVLDAVPWLADVDLAVVLEPTDGEVHLGCLGGLHATVTVLGRQAHSARPWHGRNALTAAGRLLTLFDELPPAPVLVDGVEYHDVWTVTQGTTSNARNVVPGTFTLNLNFRFAPSRSADDAAVELRERVDAWCEDVLGDDPELRVEVEVIDEAPPAAPARHDEHVSGFCAAVDVPIAGKQAWTDVARLAALGVPALNHGPGLTTQAHQRGEHVPVDALVAVHTGIARFLSGRR